MSSAPRVAVVCGSESDLPILEETTRLLDRFGVASTVTVASAHRSPARVTAFVRQAEADGSRLVIAAAGHAAHLAGVVASQTALPVVGVPIPSSALQGLDALLSMVQMPGGVPVAVMALGKAGARNAAVFAAQVLAPHHEGVAAALDAWRRELAGEAA